jgi:hypothetical protein
LSNNLRLYSGFPLDFLGQSLQAGQLEAALLTGRSAQGYQCDTLFAGGVLQCLG